MKQIQAQQSKGSGRLRIIGFVAALLILVASVIYLVLNSGNASNSGNHLIALISAIISGLGTIFGFIGIASLILPKKSAESSLQQTPPPPAPPPINIKIENVLPGNQPQQTTAPEPAKSEASEPKPQPASDSLTLRTTPLPVNSRHIQPRPVAVKEVYDMLIEPDACAVALCGMGGIGKSTLAALVYYHAEQERRAGRGPFRAESTWLRINENTTFAELAANIFAAAGKPALDLAKATAQNQAFAVLNALNTAAEPRLIVLDQFENFLDEENGRAKETSAGVGEFLDALNSQSCACRVLLTSRPHPRGTRADDPAALSIYGVGGLDEQEGAAYLRSFDGVEATDADLYEATRRCKGHALSLNLIHTMVKDSGISLATLLHDPDYQQLWRGQIAEKLLDRIFERLPALSQQLLCAFSVYREAVPVEAGLAIVDGVTRVQALALLNSLLAQHLIQSSHGLFELHPIVADYARDQLARSVTHAD